MSFLTYTYSFVATRAGTYWFAACDTPICASCNGNPSFTTQNTYGLYKSSIDAMSCSNYTFVADQNNTRVSIEQCLVAAPTSSGGIIMPFTHSLVYNAGDIAFICSATQIVLESGAYSRYTKTDQPNAICLCGTNYRTTTTTTTTSTTTAPINYIHNVRSQKICQCQDQNYFTVSSIDTNPSNYDLWKNYSIGDVWLSYGGTCYRIIQKISSSRTFPQLQNQGYPPVFSPRDCNECSGYIAQLQQTECLPTTTVAPPIVPQPSCACGAFTCSAYKITGNANDSIRWTDCAQTTNAFPYVNFGYYYFYSNETIDFCACSDSVLWVSGSPQDQAQNTLSATSPKATAGPPCRLKAPSGSNKCKSFKVELGVETHRDALQHRPILVEYEGCYEVAPPYQNFGLSTNQKTMWPTANWPSNRLFSTLPTPQPFWAPPLPANGRAIQPLNPDRKTQLYSICARGNDTVFGDPNFSGPIIKGYIGSPPSYTVLTHSTTYNYPGEADFLGTVTCQGLGCNCVSNPACTTTTTTLMPCPVCRSVQVGVTQSRYANILYEGCDNLVKHNLVNQYLIRSNTLSDICTCERCRKVRVTGLYQHGPPSLDYMSCCEKVVQAASSSFTPLVQPRNTTFVGGMPCRTYELGSGGSTTQYQYINCNDLSQIRTINLTGAATISVCAATVSSVYGYSQITNHSWCGTGSAEICISRDHYGATGFPTVSQFYDPNTTWFTFSNIGSCSCLISDDTYISGPARGLSPYLPPYGFNPYWHQRYEIDRLSVTFSNGVCTDLPYSYNLPNPAQPGCCNCKIFSVSLSLNDIVTYRPCEANMNPDSFVSLRLPAINMSGTLNSTGPFSVRISVGGFYNVGSFSIIFNHNNLTLGSGATQILHSSLQTGGRFDTVGTFSRFAWSSATPTNLGGQDILNFTFSGSGSARLVFVNDPSASFYQSTNVSQPGGLAFNIAYGNGFVQFPGSTIPFLNTSVIAPNFPSFP